MKKIMLYAGFMIALIIGIIILGIPDKQADVVSEPDPTEESQEAALTETSVKLNSISEARQKISFDIQIPAFNELGYIQSDVRIINDSILQVTYIGTDNTITYRTGEGMGNISGDYELYNIERPLSIYGTEATLRGNSVDSIQLVYFTKDDLRYSLNFEKGVTEEELVEIVGSMK